MGQAKKKKKIWYFDVELSITCKIRFTVHTVQANPLRYAQSTPASKPS